MPKFVWIRNERHNTIIYNIICMTLLDLYHVLHWDLDTEAQAIAGFGCERVWVEPAGPAEPKKRREGFDRAQPRDSRDPRARRERHRHQFGCSGGGWAKGHRQGPWPRDQGVTFRIATARSQSGSVWWIVSSKGRVKTAQDIWELEEPDCPRHVETQDPAFDCKWLQWQHDLTT